MEFIVILVLSVDAWCLFPCHHMIYIYMQEGCLKLKLGGGARVVHPSDQVRIKTEGGWFGCIKIHI